MAVMSRVDDYFNGCTPQWIPPLAFQAGDKLFTVPRRDRMEHDTRLIMEVLAQATFVEDDADNAVVSVQNADAVASWTQDDWRAFWLKGRNLVVRRSAGRQFRPFAEIMKEFTWHENHLIQVQGAGVSFTSLCLPLVNSVIPDALIHDTMPDKCNRITTMKTFIEQDQDGTGLSNGLILNALSFPLYDLRTGGNYEAIK